MERLTFEEFWQKYQDAVANNDIVGRAGLSQVMTMAAEAGLVTINGSDVTRTDDPRFKDFNVELGGTSPVVVIPRGSFPELDNYAGGDLLRYE